MARLLKGRSTKMGGLAAAGVLLIVIALPTRHLAAHPPGLAQGPDSTCGGGTAPGTVLRLALPAHSTLELVRSTDSLDYENACAARVLDRTGKVVWHRSGFWAWLDGWTGHDVNGDGHPDAVVMVDVGGGNGCCRQYTILSLQATPRALDTLEFQPVFALDSLGRTVIYHTVSFYDLGPDMADAPWLKRAFRFRNGARANVTAEYCTEFLTDTTRREGYPLPLPHTTPRARAASRTAVGKVPYKFEKTRMAVMSLALQNLECGHRDAAERLVRETWPTAEADSVFARIDAAWRKQAPATGGME